MTNEHELAWAAGFFDGEGTVYSYVPRRRHSRRVQIAVYQATPTLLERFRASVGGYGGIYGPYRGRLYHWSTKRLGAVSAVCAGLWPALGPQKRRQFERAARGRSDLERLIAGLRDPGVGTVRSWTAELAWAAGFFDGEGSVMLGRIGPPYIEISQATVDVGPSTELLRFREAVASCGRISGPRLPNNPWSRLPQYRWRAGSFECVQAVVAMLWPWLGVQKRADAQVALAGYLARKRSVQVPSGLATSPAGTFG